MNSDISNIQQLTRLLQEQEIHHIVYFSYKSNIAFNLIKHYSIVIIQHHNQQVIMLRHSFNHDLIHQTRQELNSILIVKNIGLLLLSERPHRDASP